MPIRSIQMPTSFFLRHGDVKNDVPLPIHGLLRGGDEGLRTFVSLPLGVAVAHLNLVN